MNDSIFNLHGARLARWLCVLSIVAVFSACSGPPREEVPESTYIPDASYYQLMAEIAVQRKAYLSAVEQYLNAAALSDDPELARRAAEYANEFGYESFALSGALRWLELEPDNRAAHLLAGRLYLRRYDVQHAWEHLSRAAGDDFPDGEAALALGEELAAEGNVSGVTTIFKRFVRQYPVSPGLQLAMARAAMRSGDYQLALLAARKAANADPQALEPKLLMARALMSQGRQAEAFEQIETLRGEPAQIAVELEYVRLLSAGERVSQANEQLARLVKVYGVQPDFIRIHALMNLSAGDLDTAARDFHKLLMAGQNVYEDFYYLGRIAILNGADRDGIDYFSRVRGGSYLLPAQISESLAYQKIGNPQAGLDSLQAFSKNHPRHALDVMATRAQLLFDLGETQQALATFDELLGYRPDSVELLLAYGAMLDLAGETDRSLVVMRQAVELAPMNANALNTLGYTLTNRTRHHKEAYRLIRQAIELEPDSPAIIDSMGWVLYRLGRKGEARSYLEQAYALMDDPEVIAHLAELLWATGEPDRARALLDRSIAQFPDAGLLVETRERLL